MPAIDTDAAGRHEITVDFDRHGPLTLPDEFLTRHNRPGLDGGLAPGYAVTTHAAQGSTYRTGRMLTTATSSREGVYVGLTRGTTDARLYLVTADELSPGDGPSDVGLPVLRDTRTALDALADHLNGPDQATVIAATDPDARIVHTLRTRTIDELRDIAPGDLNARKALRHIADATARHTIQHPTRRSSTASVNAQPLTRRCGQHGTTPSARPLRTTRSSDPTRRSRQLTRAAYAPRRQSTVSIR